jgi:putative SOS response-associated peptidase YedK
MMKPEKPAFRTSVNNRCLVLADGFFEWQWLDPKGKVKQKYMLNLPNKAAFAFAGLWSEWTDRVTGEVIVTYTIMTTEANALMAEIHNNKRRMPIILTPENEKLWLQGDTLEMDNDRPIAAPIA